MWKREGEERLGKKKKKIRGKETIKKIRREK